MGIDFGKAKGSKTLKDVAQKSSMYADTNMIINIPLDKLIENPDNEYLFGMLEEDVMHTANGIQQNGFRGAIEVFDLKNGFYEIYSGHMRSRAMKILKRKDIPALVYPLPEKDSDKRRALLGANLFGRNHITNSDAILVARQLSYHAETLKMENFKGDIRTEIANDFGISGSQVYKYQSLLSLIPELQKIVSRKVVPYSGIYYAKSLSQEIQLQIYEQIMDVYEKTESELSRKQTVEIITKSSGKKEMDIPGQMSISDCNDTLSESVHSEQKERIEKSVHGEQDELVEKKENDFSKCNYHIISSAPTNMGDKAIERFVIKCYKCHFQNSYYPDPRIAPEDFREKLEAECKRYHGTGGNVVDIDCKPNSITIREKGKNLTVSIVQFIKILTAALPKLSDTEKLELEIQNMANLIDKCNSETINYVDRSKVLGNLKRIKVFIETELTRIN